MISADTGRWSCPLLSALSWRIRSAPERDGLARRLVRAEVGGLFLVPHGI